MTKMPHQSSIYGQLDELLQDCNLISADQVGDAHTSSHPPPQHHLCVSSCLLKMAVEQLETNLDAFIYQPGKLAFQFASAQLHSRPDRSILRVEAEAGRFDYLRQVCGKVGAILSGRASCPRSRDGRLPLSTQPLPNSPKIFGAPPSSIHHPHHQLNQSPWVKFTDLSPVPVC